MFKRFLKAILNFIYPPRCIFCRKPLSEEGICDECLNEIPRVKGKILNPQFVAKTCAPLYYRGSVRAAIIRYKFSGRTAYATHFAKLMHEMIERRIEDPIDYITWVPLGKRKLKKRGYDQAELIARELSKIMGIPAIRTLKKIRNNKSQHKIKSESERRANVIGAYENVNYTEIWNKNVLLIDDVFTTGSTVFECARMLKIAGVVNIFVATIAKTQQKRKKRLKKVKNSL